MNKSFGKTAFGLHRQEFFIFLGLLLWMSIINVLEYEGATWGNYLKSILILGVTLLPVLLFKWYKAQLEARLSPKYYRISWFVCFGVLSPALAMIFGMAKFAGFIPDIFGLTYIWGIVLELVLLGNSYYQGQFRKSRSRKINLDSAVLIVITAITIVLAGMAASSMDNPAYHHADRLLIGYEFSPGRIFSHFGAFLTFAFQLLLVYLCGYFLFYLNSRFLVAKVLKQNGLLIYLLSGLATAAVLYPVLGQLLLWLSWGPLLRGTFNDDPFSMENAFAALTILLLSFPVLLSVQWARQNNQMMALEKEKTRTELDLLKQQLNPHFFFNTLNNLYALSLRQSEQTPESILRLSELMRYVIYNGQQAQVAIDAEMKYITDYMELQQIRLSKNVDIRFDKEIQDGSQNMAPMLLIVFVENAFKHGIEPADDAAYLHMHLKTSENRLRFSCENSFEPDESKVAGIGLKNLEKRLALLYPDKHKLRTAVENHTFKAVLELDLS